MSAAVLPCLTVGRVHRAPLFDFPVSILVTAVTPETPTSGRCFEDEILTKNVTCGVVCGGVGKNSQDVE